MSRTIRLRMVGVILAGALIGVAVPGLTGVSPGAQAVEPVGGAQPVLVTYVARVCDAYTDIMANKARNNLQESLRDLGPDSNYASNGIVTAELEQAGSPACRPLPNWRFSLGTGFAAKSSATLNLSTVTGAYPTDIVTTPSTPLLDTDGQPTGSSIAGAVTVSLTAQQQQSLSTGGQLWAQSGTPTAPLNGLQTTYGFGALRCAQDAVNGDNVERVTFPTGQRHVFCFYYSVTPPPEAGTIVVRKELADGTNGSGTFRFDGDVSYADSNGDGVNDFSLTATAGSPGSTSFIRGAVGPADPPWQFVETPTAGWNPPTAPTCTSQLGTSAIGIDATTLQVSVRLAANDLVTCTYVNSRVLTGPESISKQTVGGVGSFPFTIDVPDPNPDITATATTTQENLPVVVAAGTGNIPGVYTISEELPAATAAGSWETDSVDCDGNPVPVTVAGQVRSGSYTVAAGDSVACLVTNRFTPGGSIAIRKGTLGGVGTFDYDIQQLQASTGRTGPTYHATATTNNDVGDPVAAAPVGPASNALVVEPDTQYVINEYLPPLTALGFWRMTGVDCGPNAVTSDQGLSSAVVTLTLADPDATCTFTNEFVPSGRFTVNKTTTADSALRPGAADLEIACDDGTDVPLAVPAATTTATTGTYAVLGPVTCGISEPQTGAASGVTVTTTATVTIDGGPPQPFDLATERAQLDTGRTVVIDITNAFAPAPTPTPTPSPSGGADPTSVTGDLAATGGAVAGPPLWAAAAAALLVGVAFVVASTLRRRRQI